MGVELHDKDRRYFVKGGGMTKGGGGGGGGGFLGGGKGSGPGGGGGHEYRRDDDGREPIDQYQVDSLIRERVECKKARDFDKVFQPI